MLKKVLWTVGIVLLIGACTEESVTPATGPPVGGQAQSIGITQGGSAAVHFRMLDALNVVRSEYGIEEVELSRELNAAAKTHSRDMAVQNRPWHFGSDGSSPLDRAARAGYKGRLIGESISESFEDELTTLDAWLEEPRAREVLLSPDVANIGLGWHKQRDGKLWWTLLAGA